MKHPIKKILDKRKEGIPAGIAPYCTANNIVIETILEYYLSKDEYVLIECTANQVNQFGGYTGMTPYDFRDYVLDIADNVGFPMDKIILGADHFGPLVWQIKLKMKQCEMQKNLLN